jgi:hypothetical protein
MTTILVDSFFSGSPGTPEGWEREGSTTGPAGTSSFFSDLCVELCEFQFHLFKIRTGLDTGKSAEVAGVDSTGIEFRNGRNGDAFRLS